MAYLANGIKVFGDTLENSINIDYPIDGNRIRNLYGEIILQVQGNFIRDKYDNVVAEFYWDDDRIRDNNGMVFYPQGGSIERMKLVQLYAHAKML